MHRILQVGLSSILIERSETPEIKNIVQAFYLDFPKNSNAVDEGEALKISGWIVLKELDASAKIVINRNNKSVEAALDVDRPDVVQRVLHSTPEAMPDRVKCGFSISIPFENVGTINTIDLFCQGEYYPLRIIKRMVADAGIERATQAWNNYNLNRLDLLDEDSVKALMELDDKSVEHFILGAPKLVRASHYHKPTTNEVEPIYGFIQFLSGKNFPLQLLKSAVEKGFLLTPEPFGIGWAKCNESFHFKASAITALRFVCEDGECFYILQRISSVNAVYLPRRDLIILFGHIDYEIVKNIVLTFCHNAMENFKYSSLKKDRKFMGVIASHGRPYHFYYDVAPAVYEAYDSGELLNVPRLVYYSGADFCSFKDIFSLNCDEVVFSPDQLSDEVKKESGFYFHLGCNYNHNRQAAARSFDKLMLANVRKKFDYFKKEYIEAQSCFPLIWFGLTGQKRAWVEQIDGIAKIVIELQKTFPNIGVVFDGWTAPLTPTSVDERESNADTRVADEIKKRLPSSIRFFSIIGATSNEKIAFARIIDSYVVNSGTGSMHVARFVNKAGVGHLNTKMIDLPVHIRPNVVLVDKVDIIDEQDSAGKRMDFISYSIDWKMIYKLLNKILQE